MFISKGSQQWTGNYVSEVGGGTEERWEGAKVKKWKRSSRSHVLKLSHKQVWIQGRYVNEENYKVSPLCFCFVPKMLMSFSELRSLNYASPGFHDPKHRHQMLCLAGRKSKTHCGATTTFMEPHEAIED